MPYPHTVRFTKDGKLIFTTVVTALSHDEAVLLAKLKAGKAGVPVLETKVEVL